MSAAPVPSLDPRAAFEAELAAIRQRIWLERGGVIVTRGLMLGFLLKVQLAGWRQFCAELHLDPELCWSCLPGYDTLSTLRHLRTTPDIAEHDHSWFILTQKIIRKEFALSGSEQNPDITAKDRRAFVRSRILGKAAPEPVELVLTLDNEDLRELERIRSSRDLGEIADLPAGMPSLEAQFGGGKVGRNDPCPCGSGKKYKRCHGS